MGRSSPAHPAHDSGLMLGRGIEDKQALRAMVEEHEAKHRNRCQTNFTRLAMVAKKRVGFTHRDHFSDDQLMAYYREDPEQIEEKHPIRSHPVYCDLCGYRLDRLAKEQEMMTKQDHVETETMLDFHNGCSKEETASYVQGHLERCWNGACPMAWNRFACRKLIGTKQE